MLFAVTDVVAAAGTTVVVAVAAAAVAAAAAAPTPALHLGGPCHYPATAALPMLEAHGYGLSELVPVKYVVVVVAAAAIEPRY